MTRALKTAAAFADTGDGELAGIDDEELENLLALGLTELEKVTPTRVDLVSGPANGVPILMMKSARSRRPAGRGPRLAARMLKAQPEHRVTVHVAYPSLRPDRAVAMDGFRDFAGPDAIEQAAWSFMKSGQAIGLDHAAGTEGAGQLVESSIYRGPAYTMKAADGSEQEIAPGDWIIAVQWSPETWAAIKAGRYDGVSMQGSAVRKKPSAESLAALRKGKGGTAVPKALRKAVRAAMADVTAGVAADAAVMGQRIEALEKARGLRCGKCGKKAKVPGSAHCVKCGTRLGGQAAAKSAVAAADARLLGDVIAKAKGHDPEALVRLTRAYGAETALRLVNGEAMLSEVGGSLAKAAAALEDGAGETGECRTCDGRGRLRHPVTGKASRNCPSCRGTGQWTPGGDEADVTDEDAGLIKDYARRATAGGEGVPDAIGKLAAMVGPDIAARIVSGESFSAAEFRRSYITACRANQSARPGQEPRIPVATHVITAGDFRAGPIGQPRQQRPAPASAWPGSGGQVDYYGPGPGPGTGTRDALAGLGNTQTGPSTALPARTGW